MHLTPTEARVLGSLVEKDITTPDYYPMSLNALINACNQKNNRGPVTSLNEDSVREALSALQEKRLAGPAGGADSRITKYEHRLQEVFNFDRREIAVLCVLLLRDQQTPGELRTRTDRMYHFEALEDVVSTLDRLSQRDPSLARVLPRQPGTKESRYTHLFSEPQLSPESEKSEVLNETRRDSRLGACPERVRVADDRTGLSGRAELDGPATEARIAKLEQEVAALRQEISDLRETLAAFRKGPL